MDRQSAQRSLINPPGSEAIYNTFHLSQAVRVGDTIWVSGQVGLESNMAPAPTVEAQTRIAFASLKAVLEAAGATLADLVELTSFHTDLHGEIAAFSAVKDEFIKDRFPAWTALGVSQLAMPGLKIEIKAIAVAGCGKG